MISTKGYRIVFPIPETNFDSSWMQGEDDSHFGIQTSEGMSRRIRLCLFPALLQRSDGTLSDTNTTDITQALISHKSFFPSSGEIIVPSSDKVVSKAVVLVK